MRWTLPATFILVCSGCGDDAMTGGASESVTQGVDTAETTAASMTATMTATMTNNPQPSSPSGTDTGMDTGDTAASSGTGAVPAGTLSERYPGDIGMADDPAVLFFDNFEGGWGQWDAPNDDTRYLTLESGAAMANAGERYLRSTVTTADLAENMYISAAPRVTFDERVAEVWWRFHVRFPEIAPNPHHWMRMAAGNSTWDNSGLANTVPGGDNGFWFNFDANLDDQFNFYAYWYKMRSGRCNDGSVTPGCDGDQGTTYYFGNVLRPPQQAGFARDQWFCVELHAKANTVGDSDGGLGFWIDDAQVGDYRPGNPDGTWLRAQFHTDGCDFTACTPPAPFEGFDFRSSDEVGFKALYLDAYYERDSSAQRRMALEDRGLTVSDNQTILYDDVVVATERIGCRRPV